MNTALDTYMNCVQIPGDERHGKELQNNDLIGFEEDGKISITSNFFCISTE
jgi:hypothetical protein